MPCRSDAHDWQPTCLHSDSVGPPSATLGTPGTVLHNLSRDTSDPLTSLSFLLYLLIFPMPCSDYLPCVFLMFSLIYFHSSSSSSINSSTIVGSTQTKNLVVFQFCLCANRLLFPLQLHRQLLELPFIQPMCKLRRRNRYLAVDKVECRTSWSCDITNLVVSLSARPGVHTRTHFYSIAITLVLCTSLHQIYTFKEFSCGSFPTSC